MKRTGVTLVAALSLAACGPSIEDRMAATTVSELKGQLRDPGSLVLADTKVRISGRWGAICGEYNAANGSGGMAGSRRFVRVFSPRELTILQSRDISEQTRDAGWQAIQTSLRYEEQAAGRVAVHDRVERTRGLFLEITDPILTVRYLADRCVMDAKPIPMKP